MNNNPLEKYIRQERKKRPILIMSHLVLGYPDFAVNKQQIAKMIQAGVELIEMQIPFSEPTADGPIITKANHDALRQNVKVKDCLAFAKKMTRAYPKQAFIFMSYANILFTRGFFEIIKQTKESGVKGWIVPDLPPEEAEEYLAACYKYQIAPIFIYTPFHKPKRLKELANYSQGMVYAVTRQGVTGKSSDFKDPLTKQLLLYRQNTDLPLAAGFGITEPADVDFLINKADIAVIGSKLITIVDQQGLTALYDFLCSLRK